MMRGFPVRLSVRIAQRCNINHITLWLMSSLMYFGNIYTIASNSRLMRAYLKEQGSSVNKVTVYRLQPGFNSRQRQWLDLCNLRHHVHTSSGGTPPPSCVMVTGAVSPEVKRPEPEAEHSSPFSADVMNVLSHYTSTPHIRLHGVVSS